MTILFGGTEDISFPERSLSVSTISGYRRTDFSRCALYMLNTGHYIKSPAMTPFSSVWMSCQLYRANFSYVAAGVRGIGLAKSGTNAWIGIGPGSTNNKVAVITYDGTNTVRIAEETGTSLTSAALYKIDINITSYGASGNIKVYVDGVLIIDYTGNIAVLSQTTLDQVHILSTNSTYFTPVVSEIIVADEDTRLLSLCTLAPSAAGDASAWTGGYADIDEVTSSDADTAYSATANQELQVNLTNTPTGDYSCKAVIIAARMADSVGGMNAQMGVRTNSATHLGSTLDLDASMATYQSILATNPATSSSFSIAELDALQFAVKSVAE